MQVMIICTSFWSFVPPNKTNRVILISCTDFCTIPDQVMIICNCFWSLDQVMIFCTCFRSLDQVMIFYTCFWTLVTVLVPSPNTIIDHVMIFCTCFRSLVPILYLFNSAVPVKMFFCTFRTCLAVFESYWFMK